MKYPPTQYLLPLVILSNLFPLYGVLHYNWSIFSIVYIYWLELLIITFFDVFRMLLSQGDISETIASRTWSAIKFLLLRSGVFFFYLLFIVVFLGFMVTGQEKLEGSGIGEVMILRGPFYKIVLLNFFVYNLIEFLFLFILFKGYKTSVASQHYGIFNSHMIVVHVVVVLGTFLYEFVLKKFNADHRAAMIACVCLFILVKILVDLGRQSLQVRGPQKEVGDFI